MSPASAAGLILRLHRDLRALKYRGHSGTGNSGEAASPALFFSTEHAFSHFSLMSSFTPCLRKKVGHFCFIFIFIFAITSEKSGPIFVIFTVKFRKDLRRKLKTITSPQICCRTTLRNVGGQLHSFAAPFI